MNVFNFKLAKQYDIDYMLTTLICKNGIFVSNKQKLTMQDIMFYKSTESQYVFYAKKSGKFIRIKKSNLIDAREL